MASRISRDMRSLSRGPVDTCRHMIHISLASYSAKPTGSLRRRTVFYGRGGLIYSYGNHDFEDDVFENLTKHCSAVH
jgi:hypothetical protein